MGQLILNSNILTFTFHFLQSMYVHAVNALAQHLLTYWLLPLWRYSAAFFENSMRSSMWIFYSSHIPKFLIDVIKHLPLPRPHLLIFIVFKCQLPFNFNFFILYYSLLRDSSIQKKFDYRLKKLTICTYYVTTVVTSALFSLLRKTSPKVPWKGKTWSNLSKSKASSNLSSHFSEIAPILSSSSQLGKFN